MRQNNSVVAWREIGEGAAALMCLTDKTDCCDTTDSRGNSTWYHPNGGGSAVLQLGDEAYYQTYRKSSILLEHQNGSTVPKVTGVFHCEVVDNNGTMQRLYIGIYPSTDSTNRKFHTIIIPECLN